MAQYSATQAMLANYADLEAEEFTEYLYGVGSVLGTVAPSGQYPAAQEATQPFTT